MTVMTLPRTPSAASFPEHMPRPLVTYIDRDVEVVVPCDAGTLHGFRGWIHSRNFPARAKIFFLDGEVYIDMSPEEIETHNKIKVEVCRSLANLNRRLRLGEFLTDGVFITNDEANLGTEPDSMFLTWKSLESGRVQMIQRQGSEEQFIEVRGSPDVVVEVVSQGSVGKDTRRLRELYLRANVSEYWLIDARGDEIEFQLLVRKGDEWEAAKNQKGWVRSPTFGRLFRLVRKRTRLNRWEYTLQVKVQRK